VGGKAGVPFLLHSFGPAWGSTWNHSRNPWGWTDASYMQELFCKPGRQSLRV